MFVSTLFGYILFGGLTMLFLDALLSMSYQNIIVYFAWITSYDGFSSEYSFNYR